MAFPPPTIATGKTNTLPQGTDHPAHHNALAQAVNDITTRLTDLIAEVAAIPSGGGGGGTSTVAGATDVAFTSLADDDLVIWDTATSKFINRQLDAMAAFVALSGQVATNAASLAGLSNQSTMVGQRGLNTMLTNSTSVMTDLYSASTTTLLNDADKLIYTSSWLFYNEATVGGAAATFHLLFKIGGLNTYQLDIVLPATGTGKRYLCNLTVEYTSGATQTAEKTYELHCTVYAASANDTHSAVAAGTVFDYGAIVDVTTDFGPGRPSMEARWNATAAVATTQLRRETSSLILNRAA